MEKENNNPLIKKKDSLIKFEPQKKKELIIRGLKESDSRLIIIFIDEDESIHSIYDKEFYKRYKNEINLIHFYNSIDAFNYMAFNRTHLVIMGDEKGWNHGFLIEGKILYPCLPFIYNNKKGIILDFDFPDSFVKKHNFIGLFESIESLIDINISTSTYTSKKTFKEVNKILKPGIINKTGTESLNIYLKILKIDPDNAYAHFHAGNMYQDQPMCHEGLFHHAIEAYNNAIKIKPDFAEAYFGMGLAYENQDEYIKAITAYKKALEINPEICEMSHIYDYLGTMYLKIDKYQEVHCF